jgi:polygalacturonase
LFRFQSGDLVINTSITHIVHVRAWFTIILVSLFFMLPYAVNAQPIGVQSPLLTPGKSQLVQQLETILYADNFCIIPNRIFNASDFGAMGDGKSLNTKAIQRTIDSVSAAGGGMVTFNPGVYVTGGLFIKTDVDFHIPEGVTIQAVQNDEQFPDTLSRIAGITMKWPAALINIYREKNARVSGNGTLDGNGKYWWDKFWGDPPRSGGMYQEYIHRGLRWAIDFDCKRVRALVVYESERVVIRDVHIYRSGFWTISLTYSNQVHVDGVTIRNNYDGHVGPSSDGINTDSGKDILVENCDIDCNDDNLCLKAGRDADGLRVNRPTERVVYRNCIARSGDGLFAIGSETSGGMHDIEVYGLKAIGTNTGIRFKSAKIRGGVVHDIYIHDIEMDSVANPFSFDLNWYPSFSYPVIPDSILRSEYKDHWRTMTMRVDPPERGIPEFRNITFENISVKHGGTGIYVNAYPEKPMNSIVWKNIVMEAHTPGKISFAKDWIMENVTLLTPSEEPIKLNHVENIQLPLTFKVLEKFRDSVDPAEKDRNLRH